MIGLVVHAGDIAPIPAMILLDQGGSPVNLNPLTSLKFHMVGIHSGHVAVNMQNATKAQDDDDEETFGQVYYQWVAGDTVTPGIYRAWFVVDQGSGQARYPLEEDFCILIKPVS